MTNSDKANAAINRVARLMSCPPGASEWISDCARVPIDRTIRTRRAACGTAALRYRRFQRWDRAAPSGTRPPQSGLLREGARDHERRRRREPADYHGLQRAPGW